MVDWATMVVGQGDPVEVADAARRASLQVSRAGRHIGQEAIQLHGGIAMTAEYSVGMYTATSPRSTTCSATAATTCASWPARSRRTTPSTRSTERRSRKVRAGAGLEEDAETGPVPRPWRCHRSPGAGCASPRCWSTRSLLAAWIKLLGIPNDTVSGVRLAVVRHHRLAHRGAVALPPAVPARLVAPDARPDRLLLQPRPHRRARPAGARHDADPVRRVDRGRHPADRVAPGASLR